MADAQLALPVGQVEVVEFICMEKHADDPVNAEGYTLTIHRELGSYCARGAQRNHAWVRVPATPLSCITTGKMEDRPPDSCAPHDRGAQR